MTTAERNRAIKTLLTKTFGQGKVRVTGGRGTAYGWVHVHISYSPRNNREAGEMRQKVEQLISVAKVEIGTYGYDDPGSDYGYGKEILINFDQCREKADSWSDQAYRHHLSAEDWDHINATEGVTP